MKPYFGMFSGRNFGKSIVMEYLIEEALNEGKTLLIGTLQGWVKKKRVKHLTVIETIKEK
jgi:hypothetical protein